jgi:hypothetical protein
MSTFHLTELSDYDLRAALFQALVERLDAKVRADPSIVPLNRMPTVLTVSRRGNLLTLSQGIGPLLLRGDLKGKDRREGLRSFTVGRATIQSRLAITPDGVEGTPDEILDWILAMFLEWTAAGEDPPIPLAPERPPAPRPAPQETQPSSRSVRQASPPTARPPQSHPTSREAIAERRATSAGSSQERRPAAPQTRREKRPSEAAAVPPRPATTPHMTTPTARTYQLLLETAQEQLHQADALPAGSRSGLISAGVFVALTAEAFFNDLGSRVIPSWSQLQRLDPREKAEVLNIELFNDKVDWSVRPFQSVASALGFRRALAHAHAETLPFDEVPTADRKENAVPRTRRTAWQEHCDIATIQQWIIDVRLLIDFFARAHDRS